jgi:hypothetical protein
MTSDAYAYKTTDYRNQHPMSKCSVNQHRCIGHGWSKCRSPQIIPDRPWIAPDWNLTFFMPSINLDRPRTNSRQCTPETVGGYPTGSTRALVPRSTLDYFVFIVAGEASRSAFYRSLSNIDLIWTSSTLEPGFCTAWVPAVDDCYYTRVLFWIFVEKEAFQFFSNRDHDFTSAQFLRKTSNNSPLFVNTLYPF